MKYDNRLLSCIIQEVITKVHKVIIKYRIRNDELYIVVEPNLSRLAVRAGLLKLQLEKPSGSNVQFIVANWTISGNLYFDLGLFRKSENSNLMKYRRTVWQWT